MDTPTHLRYTKSHEWISPVEDGIITVGITDHAQDQLGDVVFVELPDVGQKVSAGAAVAVIESVKTASDIYAPMAGTIVAVNEALETAPETINSSPFQDGWLFRIEVTDASAREALLDAAGYKQAVEQEEA